MTDIVNTTGRHMTAALQDALDDLTGQSRAFVVQALTEQAALSPTLGKLYRALVLELKLAALREDDLMRRLAVEHQASIPEPPLPRATGPAFTIYPDDLDAA